MLAPSLAPLDCAGAVPLDSMRSFYRECFGLEPAETAEDYSVLESAAWVLSLVVIPDTIASALPEEFPPSRREETPIKLAFQVQDIEVLRPVMAALGGRPIRLTRSGTSVAGDIVTEWTPRATSCRLPSRCLKRVPAGYARRSGDRGLRRSRGRPSAGCRCVEPVDAEAGAGEDRDVHELWPQRTEQAKDHITDPLDHLPPGVPAEGQLQLAGRPRITPGRCQCADLVARYKARVSVQADNPQEVDISPQVSLRYCARGWRDALAAP